MLGLMQRSSFWHCIVFYALRLISESLSKSGNALIFLVSPEDTIEGAGEGQMQIAKYERVDIRGVIKVVFWMAISITLSLLIGKLS
ncbi:MAG: hypothetical protein PVH87_04750 [Desulfobacteraceae bacterium]